MSSHSIRYNFCVERIGISMASVIDIVFGIVMFVIGFFVGISKNE